MSGVPFLGERHRKARLERLARELEGPVRVTLLTRPASAVLVAGEPPDVAADDLREVERLAGELRELAPAVTVELYDARRQPRLAAALGVTQLPTLIVAGLDEPGLRFVGAPRGRLRRAMLDSIRRASAGDCELPQAVRRALRELPADVHLRLFATPT